jgi:hypothetical protein
MKLLFLCLFVLAMVAELTDEQTQAVKNRRLAEIQKATSEIERLEAAMKHELRQRTATPESISRTKKEIKELKKAASIARNMSDEHVLGLVERDAVAARAAAAAEKHEREEKEENERLLTAAGPVVILKQGITTNVIGLPELHLKVRNNTTNTVEAFDICADCFNKFDEPVMQIGGSNRYLGTQQRSIGPGEEVMCTWQLSLQRNTIKAHAWISRVKLSQGPVWNQSKEQAARTPFGLARARMVE